MADTRTQVALTCPGTQTNYKVIVHTAWQSRYGLGNPTNVGSCPLFLAPLGSDGEPIDNGRKDVKLDPGGSVPWYYPPDGTAKIVAVCSKACSGGSAVLEYDTPNA